MNRTPQLIDLTHPPIDRALHYGRLSASSRRGCALALMTVCLVLSLGVYRPALSAEQPNADSQAASPGSGSLPAPAALGSTDSSTPQPLVANGPALTSAPVSGVFNRNGEAPEDKQRLGIGDRISFRVVEDQEEARLLTITDAGKLDVPELGLVTAVGKTCKELASEIKRRLEETTYYKATVILGIDQLNRTVSGRKVYVVGQVRVTGPQEIPAGESWTVSRAIMKAGGFTEYADKKHVRLVRGSGEGKTGKTFYVNVAEIWERGRTELDLAVEPEDLIYVPTRAVNFY